jgi:hypothetical protein
MSLPVPDNNAARPSRPKSPALKHKDVQKALAADHTITGIGNVRLDVSSMSSMQAKYLQTLDYLPRNCYCREQKEGWWTHHWHNRPRWNILH